MNGPEGWKQGMRSKPSPSGELSLLSNPQAPNSIAKATHRKRGLHGIDRQEGDKSQAVICNVDDILSAAGTGCRPARVATGLNLRPMGMWRGASTDQVRRSVMTQAHKPYVTGGEVVP